MVKSLLFIKDGAEDREEHSEPDLVKKTDRLRITENLPKIRIFLYREPTDSGGVISRQIV